MKEEAQAAPRCRGRRPADADATPPPMPVADADEIAPLPGPLVPGGMASRVSENIKRTRARSLGGPAVVCAEILATRRELPKNRWILFPLNAEINSLSHSTHDLHTNNQLPTKTIGATQRA